MKQVLALTAFLALGLIAGFAAFSPPARAAGISCATNSAAEVAAATVSDLGNGWSQPGQGDLWDVNMADIAYDVSVYAQDAAGASVAAKASLDQQIATLGCGATTSTTATTTQATTTTAPPVTVTTTLPAQTITNTVTTVAPLWLPAQTVTTTATTTVTATVTTPAAKSQPINITVNVAGAKKCKAARAVKTKR